MWKTGLNALIDAQKDFDEYGYMVDRAALKDRIFKMASRLQAQTLELEEIHATNARLREIIKRMEEERHIVKNQ